MEFHNNRSIFIQIADSIAEKIVSGVFPPGEKMPSVRELAADLGVNPNTVMRTYGELQSLQIIDNKRGIGYFVNAGARNHILDRKKKEFFEQVLPELLRQARLLGIDSTELRKHLGN